MEHTPNKDQLFLQMVLSLQMGAMHQLGKIASPLTGKVERDLTMAQASIDMLAMLQEKTKGNLTSEEESFLSRVLYELRLNYVDESKKPDPVEEQEDQKPDDQKPDDQKPDEDTQTESKSSDN